MIRPWTNHPRSEIAAAVFLAAAALAGCARNPVSGNRQLMLITEKQEFAIGEGADRQIREETGVYLDDPELRAYVDRVGNALAARSERADLIFHFEVLNTPEINAFALPGGFVYVTRGMLERLSSEDELAMVLGHEIGHVTARHGAARISRAYAMQYGSLIGTVISPTLANYGDLINLALDVALSRYSREQESEADRLGLAYSGEAGYQPDAGLNVMRILKWMEGDEPGALEKWFLSHPPADERIHDVTETNAELRAVDPSIEERGVRREEYLKRIDGMVVGLYNGAEMVLKDRYYNKELAGSIEVPAGWEVNLHARDSLVVMSHGEKGSEEYILLGAEPLHTATTPAGAEAAFEESLRRRGWKRESGREDRTDQGVEARLATYTGRSSEGEEVGILRAFIVHGKRAWSVTAATALESLPERRERYEAVALRIRFLSSEEVAGLKPPRVRVIEAPAGATWSALAGEHTGDPEGGDRLAFYNGMEPDDPPAEATLIKLPPSLATGPG